MKLLKQRWVPALFTAISVTIFTSFGVWQLQRLELKTQLIEKIAKAQEATALGTLPESLEGLEFRNVALTGTFMHDKMMHMVGRPQGQGDGFYVLTPLRLEDDGRIILVNRGFSPKDHESKPEGIQTVVGVIRPIRTQRYFSPENQPDKNVWFYEDIDVMAQYTGFKLAPLVVEAIGKEEKGVYPVPNDGKVIIRNDHLHYAIMWFSLAVVSLAMYGFWWNAEKKKAAGLN